MHARDFPDCPAWLGLHASTGRGVGSVPGRGTKILHGTWCGPKNRKYKLHAEGYFIKKDITNWKRAMKKTKGIAWGEGSLAYKRDF